jgi:hypothetical protein
VNRAQAFQFELDAMVVFVMGVSMEALLPRLFNGMACRKGLPHPSLPL